MAANSPFTATAVAPLLRFDEPSNAIFRDDVVDI